MVFFLFLSFYKYWKSLKVLSFFFFQKSEFNKNFFGINQKYLDIHSILIFVSITSIPKYYETIALIKKVVEKKWKNLIPIQKSF